MVLKHLRSVQSCHDKNLYILEWTHKSRCISAPASPIIWQERQKTSSWLTAFFSGYAHFGATRSLIVIWLDEVFCPSCQIIWSNAQSQPGHLLWWSPANLPEFKVGGHKLKQYKNNTRSKWMYFFVWMSSNLGCAYWVNICFSQKGCQFWLTSAW